MAFPIAPPIEPMLARPTPELPIGEGWRYEPKWDGFRALVFRDGADLYIQSRDLKPLDRYFPEQLPPLLAPGGPGGRVVPAGGGGGEAGVLFGVRLPGLGSGRPARCAARRAAPSAGGAGRRTAAIGPADA